ncbi:YdgA family protein [Avibacterium sp. 21-586]|uniref:YdgA family protein n=1 Tax=Avibacterium sp. 21-586 TaxID=2911534 RepID=UPI002247B6C8|nr:YdgA family protein [Avibacterium sp. 21-586]MCW9709402.1 YdgA family protein [Avibacterium sp. 21-586]
MKKSVLSVGLITILGATWCGGAWYTGKIAEQKYANYIQFSNQHLQQSFANTGYSVQIKDAVLDRGFFSSNVRYQLEIKGEDLNETIPFVGKIHHGPITLNDFSFALFSADTEVEKTQNTQAYFADNGKNPLRTVTTMSYGQEIKGKVYSDVAHKTADQIEMAWNLDGKFDIDQKGYGKSEIDIGQFSLIVDNKDHLQIENLKGKSDISPTPWKNIYQGDTDISIEKMSLHKSENNVDLVLDNIDIENKINEKNGFLGVNFDYNVKNILVNNKAITGLKFKGALNHILGNAVNRLNELDEHNFNNDKIISQVQKEILANQPVLDIDKLELFNDKGKAFEAEVKFALSKAFQRALENEKVFDAFDTFKINAESEKKALVQLVQNIFAVNPSTQQVSEQEVESIVQKYLAEMEKNNFLTVKDDNANFNVLLDKDKQKLSFNHQEMSERDIGMAIMLFMMGR